MENNNKVKECLAEKGIKDFHYVKECPNLTLSFEDEKLKGNYIAFYNFQYNNKKFTLAANRFIDVDISYSDSFHGYDGYTEDGDLYEIDNDSHFDIPGYDDSIDGECGFEVIQIILDAIKEKPQYSSVLEEIEDNEYPYVMSIKLPEESKIVDFKKPLWNSLLLDEEGKTCNKEDEDTKELVRFFNDSLFQDLDSEIVDDKELNTASKFLAKLIA